MPVADWKSYHFPTKIRDEIPKNRDEIVIEYKGPNPIKIYKNLTNMCKRIWEVKGTQMYEPDFRWDTTSDPHAFFFQIYVQKGMDKFTKYRVDIKMKGSQPNDPKNNGELKIEIHGFIETDFSSFLGDKFGTPEQKLKAGVMNIIWPMMYYPFMKGYYNPLRRRYFIYHRRRIERLANEMRAMLNIPLKPLS